jgi:hypothetical protein
MPSIHKMLCNTWNHTLKYHKKKPYPPLCMDCNYFVPLFLSPHFPNASCDRFTEFIPCIKARIDKNLCGFDGKFFEK